VNDGERDSDEKDREQRRQVGRKRPPQGPAGSVSVFPGLIDLCGHGANIRPVRCADAVYPVNGARGGTRSMTLNRAASVAYCFPSADGSAVSILRRKAVTPQLRCGMLSFYRP
jgi:hypothetical protein